MAMGLMVIWLTELRSAALSIAAFVVALVIATREFIQCFLGSLYVTAARPFSVGDWVQVGPHYGEVAHSDWFSTVLLEIDMESMSYAYTGKTLTIPNNQFVAGNIHYLNYMRRYVAHSFSIVRDAEGVDLFAAKALILNKAQEYCASFVEVAKRYSELIEKRLGVNIVDPKASVRITTTNLGKNQLAVTIFCPTKEAVDIEQKLIRDFMTFWYAEMARLKADETPPSNTAEDDEEV